jgi:hypothetical protein
VSELSKVYGQYQGSLVSSQYEYEERLKTHAKHLKGRFQELVAEFVAIGDPIYSISQVEQV